MKYTVKKVLFLGVGGVSMHQLAIALKKMGVIVYGYDLHKSKYTTMCEKEGITVFNKFNKDICKVDLCVKTSAVKNTKFLNFLNKHNIPIIDRADLLGWFLTKFKYVIGIAGTHGKSTTSALIYHILSCANKKVSCHIGADIENMRFNIGDDYLVVEACEYNKSFLKLKPNMSVVTNIECEHMDSYKTLFNLRGAFLVFLKRAEKRFVYKEKSTNFLKKLKNINFIQPTDLKIDPIIKGDYNLKNIAVAVNVCKELGIDNKTIVDAVNSFKGVKRRYEYLGEANNSKIYIDYAHHPTEIKAFMNTFFKEGENNQIIFQPHTYSRTKTFFKEFIKTFSEVENLIIYKEYSAREKPEKGMSAKELYLGIKKVNPNVKYCATKKSVGKNLLKNANIAFVGAGDINLIASDIVKSS